MPHQLRNEYQKTMNCRRFLGYFATSILLLGSPHGTLQNPCSIPRSCSSAQKPPTNDTTFLLQCRCDEKCLMYNDCCFDARLAATSRKRNETMKQRSGQIECQMFPGVDKNPVFLVRLCPQSYLDTNISVRCNNITMASDAKDHYPRQLSIEHVLQKLPVSSKTSGILYRNAFCAICNEDIDFEFWKLRLESNKPIESNHTDLALTDLLGVINDTEISYSAPRDDLSARSCRPSVAKCLPKWSRNVTEEVEFIRNECRRYQSYVKWNSVVYRNPHCAQCNLISEVNLSCSDIRNVTPFATSLDPLPYSVLLDFNSELWNFWTLPNSILGNRPPTDDLMEDCDTSNETSCLPPRTCDSGDDSCPQVPISDLKNAGKTTGELILGYLTFVGNILSIFSLSFLLLAYCCFPSLRNTPGRCLMCLCVSLLLAQLLFAAFGNYDNQILSFDPMPVEESENETDALDQYNETESIRNKSTTFLDDSLPSTTIGADKVLDQQRGRNDTQPYPKSTIDVRDGAPTTTWLTSNDSSQEDDVLSMRPGSTSVQWTFRKDAKSIVCYTSSLINHYFFLAYFCWSNAMAIDVWRTFRKLSSSLPSQAELRKRHFIYYSVYCWSVPAAIVTVAVVMDVIEATVRPMYAVRYCLISNPVALLVFSYVPCLLVTATNILLFILSSVNICFSSMDDVQSRFGGRGLEGRQRLFLYVRLATIMGVTWASGLLATVTKSTVLWYVFVITTAFQGFFIALCFLATNQVRRMIKEKMKLNYTSSVTTKSTYK